MRKKLSPCWGCEGTYENTARNHLIEFRWSQNHTGSRSNGAGADSESTHGIAAFVVVDLGLLERDAINIARHGRQSARWVMTFSCLPEFAALTRTGSKISIGSILLPSQYGLGNFVAVQEENVVGALENPRLNQPLTQLKGHGAQYGPGVTK